MDFRASEYASYPPTMLYVSIAAAVFSCADPPNVISPVLLDSILNESDSLELSCVFTGIPPPEVVWTFTVGSISSVIAANTANISSTGLSDSQLPAVQSTLFIPNIVKSNEGQYTCLGINNVTNLIDAVNTTSANITVQGESLHDSVLVVVVTVSILLQQCPPLSSQLTGPSKTEWLLGT